MAGSCCPRHLPITWETTSPVGRCATKYSVGYGNVGYAFGALQPVVFSACYKFIRTSITNAAVFRYKAGFVLFYRNMRSRSMSFRLYLTRASQGHFRWLFMSGHPQLAPNFSMSCKQLVLHLTRNTSALLICGLKILMFLQIDWKRLDKIRFHPRSSALLYCQETTK